MGASLLQRLDARKGARCSGFGRSAGRCRRSGRRASAIDAVVCDIRLPDGSARDLYDTLTRTGTPPPFLFITGQGGIDQAVRLIRSGAADTLPSPSTSGAFSYGWRW